MTSSEGRPQDPSYPQLARSRRRLLAPLLAAVAGLVKAGGLLLKLKAFTLVGSMLLSVGAYALLYGWRFAVGLVVLIGVHETGHVVVLRARGIDAGLPVFLPFLGAFVAMKEQPRSAWDEALSGLAGPVVGTAGAFAALGLADVYDSQLLRVLAYVGFFVNLV
ncbi:MAG: site-2 protease family protein, partial [Mycobacteriales bacterium]